MGKGKPENEGERRSMRLVNAESRKKNRTVDYVGLHRGVYSRRKGIGRKRGEKHLCIDKARVKRKFVKRKDSKHPLLGGQPLVRGQSLWETRKEKENLFIVVTTKVA